MTTTNPTTDTTQADLIGPLTAAEWASLRLGSPTDPLHCCADTSDVRDAIFHTLRMGGDPDQDHPLRAVWHVVDDHGTLGADPRLAKLFAYYVSGKDELPSDEAVASLYASDPGFVDSLLEHLPQHLDLTSPAGRVVALGRVAPKVAYLLDAGKRAAAVAQLAELAKQPPFLVARVVDAWRGNIGMSVDPPTEPCTEE
ncbi:hypothetical protein ACIBTV_26740 [Micromonospora sp. NPDC049366]|uniref:hypothetical protein n=1 Tax=Micromonospora sp. NPDC049366 TaxID=3364271 RepID=UPI003789BCAF